MLSPHSFAIHVTYTCPLSCDHCCFSSSPQNQERLPTDHIIKTINAIDTSTVKLVAFTGGEPFLLGDDLVKLVSIASNRGFNVRIVTSAFWGKDRKIAKKRLLKLYESGLKEISISWDDFHEKFVSFEHVYNVFWSAVECGILPAINIVQAEKSYWTSAKVREELGIGDLFPDLVAETPLNRTGRAEKNLKEAGLRPQRIVGPCPYVLTGPTLSAKNKLLACCGVIPNTEALILDHDFKPENLHSAMQKGLKSPLLNWIFLRGPYAVMEYISQKHNIPIPDKSNVGGNCEACKLLFERKDISKKIPEAISDKAEEINGELHLLETLGLLNEHVIQRLWKSQSRVLAKVDTHSDTTAGNEI